MSEEAFHRVINNKTSRNACVVKAIQAVTGLERYKIAMAVRYKPAYGVELDDVVNGLAFLTGNVWKQFNGQRIPLCQLDINKALVIVGHPNLPPYLMHMIAVIGNDVFDALHTVSKTTDACWVGWFVHCYFKEEQRG